MAKYALIFVKQIEYRVISITNVKKVHERMYKFKRNGRTIHRIIELIHDDYEYLSMVKNNLNARLPKLCLNRISDSVYNLAEKSVEENDVAMISNNNIKPDENNDHLNDNSLFQNVSGRISNKLDHIMGMSMLNVTAMDIDTSFLENLDDNELVSVENDNDTVIDFVRCTDSNDILGSLSPPPIHLKLQDNDVPLPTIDNTCDNLCLQNLNDKKSNVENSYAESSHNENSDVENFNNKNSTFDDDTNDKDYQSDSSINSSDDNIHDKSDVHDKDATSDSNKTFNISCSPGALDDKKLVAKSKTSSKTKYNFCFYCKKMQSVISRHLENVHKDQEEVKKFRVLPKGNIERKKIIETIRLKGNYIHNKYAEYNKNGEYIVSRRPKENRSAELYKICHNCKGSFSIKTIRRHRQRCIGESSKGNRTNTIFSRKIAGRIHSKANHQLKNNVFCVLREDEVVRLIRYDELLIVFANTLCLKYRKQQQHDLIRARLRLLGRFLLILKSINSHITDFASLYKPKSYDDVLSAIDKLACLDHVKGEYGKPYIVTTIGTYLRVVGEAFIVECIKKDDEQNKKLAEDFLKVHKATYPNRMNKIAVENQTKKNRLLQEPLPTMDDVEKLTNFLENKRETYFEKLSLNYSQETWLELCKLTLVRLFVFNRRRTGEIERLKIDDFKSCEKLTRENNREVYDSLDNDEKSLVSKYARVTACGNKGRTVPALISQEIEKGIDLILKFRFAAKVHNQNPYVFGLPGFNCGRFKHLRGHELLREYSTQCGAENPERLRGTLLRKHVATFCASENVDANKVSDIANFMGHEDPIDKKNYVRTVFTRDICGVGTYLERANRLPSIREKLKIRNQPIRSSSENSVNSGGDISEPDNSLNNNDLFFTTNLPKDKPKKVFPTKNRKLRWSEEEKSLCLSTFKLHIKNAKLPSSEEIRMILSENPIIFIFQDRWSRFTSFFRGCCV